MIQAGHWVSRLSIWKLAICLGDVNDDLSKKVWNIAWNSDDGFPPQSMWLTNASSLYSFSWTELIDLKFLWQFARDDLNLGNHSFTNKTDENTVPIQAVVTAAQLKTCVWMKTSHCNEDCEGKSCFQTPWSSFLGKANDQKKWRRYHFADTKIHHTKRVKGPKCWHDFFSGHWSE